MTTNDKALRRNHYRDGPGGPPLAARFAGAGKNVAIIERDKSGGTCVNTGCTPTTTLVASAYAIHVARRGAEYGFATGVVHAALGAFYSAQLTRCGNLTWGEVPN